jgi:hypothetical protein
MKHLFTCLLAGIVSGAVAWGVLRYVPQAPPPLRAQVWEGLSQDEVNRLTAMLAKVPRHPVAILCSHLCDDLAIDFDNAFESAHWESGIERPLVDTNTGINVCCVSPARDTDDRADIAARDAHNEDVQALAAAIGRATAHRLEPGLIEGRIDGDRLAVVISRKK